MGIVVTGVAWLVRTPTPSTEAGLPFATASVTTTMADGPLPTLAPPGPAGSLPATSADLSVPLRVVVHVAGAVVRPGVYELVAGDRVDAAIAMAGGPTTDAELDGLNLASPLADGQRVYVPVAGEIDPASVPSGASPGSVTAGSDAGRFPSGPIDVNTASVDELESLPGVGPATAAAIIDDRERNGPFATVGDLERVPGIGPAKLAAIADSVTV